MARGFYQIFKKFIFAPRKKPLLCKSSGFDSFVCFPVLTAGTKKCIDRHLIAVVRRSKFQPF